MEHVRQGGVPMSPDPRRRYLRDELLQHRSNEAKRTPAQVFWGAINHEVRQEA
jgi:hypothetical protein